MKKQFVTALALVIVLLATPFTALAQGYSFSLDKENVVVFLNEDSSISLDYTFVFTNDSGAHAIDFVDVGMPNASFDIDNASADVNGTPVKVSQSDYQGNGSGFAVVLGTESIQPGGTGTVHVSVGRITSVLNRDSRDTKYASFVFSPTWFGPEFVHGNTDLSVAFHLPPGVKPEEPRFHLRDVAWLGADEPDRDLDDTGRIVYTWHSEAANGHTQYMFGASFPMSYVPAYATQLAQPTLPPPTIPVYPTPQPQTEGNALGGWLVVALIIIFLIGGFSYVNRSSASDYREDYARPQVSVEGYGIKRGLTAVEAAVMLEQPLDKVLTMILFGVVKKGLAKIVKRDPLQLDIATSLPEDLYIYEKNFLEAFRSDNARQREEELQSMFIALIKAVSEKMRGFSKDETQLYYREMMKRAWQQVEEANTPELKNREFDQSFDWLMLNRRFGEDVQELFKDPGMTVPQWWNAYDQGIKLSENHLPTFEHRDEDRSSGSDSRSDSEVPVFRPHSEPSPTSVSLPTAKEARPASSALPGAEYAASIVNSVQDFSSRAISDLGKFTERVHEVTNLQPIYSYWEAPKRDPGFYGVEDKSSDGGFFSWLGSSSSSSGSHSSSSSHHSSCACACAGCACACAGGGR